MFPRLLVFKLRLYKNDLLKINKLILTQLLL